uniref:Uncharacterized protein n=1 Tax=Strigamia maritima TaxID=126957 RepID=T1J826_STRMM
MLFALLFIRKFLALADELKSNVVYTLILVVMAIWIYFKHTARQFLYDVDYCVWSAAATVACGLQWLIE